MIITTILIVGVSAVDVGAQEATGDKILGISRDIFISTIATSVVIIITAGISAWRSNRSLNTTLNTYKGEHVKTHKEHENRHDKEGKKTLGDINVFVVRRSPRQLNKEGIEALKESGAGEYLEEHKTELYKEFEGLKEAWKIDEKARLVIWYKQDTKALEPVKKWAYESGNNYNDILTAMAVELRNKAINYYNIPTPEKQEATTKQYK